VRVQPVLRQAGQPRGGDPHGADVVADVAVELLADLGEPRVDGRQPGPGLAVEIDAGAAEVLERLVQQASGHRGEPVAVQRREDVVEHTVLAQLGHQPVDLDGRLLAAGPHALDRVDVGEQGPEGGDVAQLQRHLVPGAEHAERVIRRLRAQARDEVACGGQPVPGVGLHPLLRVVVPGPRERGRRHGARLPRRLVR
jgi:hypothetical protein